MDPLSLYVHIPFCATKCPYCDFNTYAGIEALMPVYVAALERELKLWGDVLGRPPVTTVFFGGGTPSYLGASNLERILSAAHRAFAIDEAAEVTLEANPDDVTLDLARSLRALEVNRLSMGVQSFDDGLLRMLGRRHDADQAEAAFLRVREAGFDDVSLDLMYGLPQQSLEQWRATLERALRLSPEHLSLYCLTLESGTPMEHEVRAGELPEADADLAADMYLLAEEQLGEAGYGHYEISNWAKPNHESRHNLVYWRNGSYVGVGPGAHSGLQGYRFANLRSPREYVRRMEAWLPHSEGPWEKIDEARLRGVPVVEEVEALDERTQMGETMMLGLRLSEGVGAEGFRRRFGRELGEVYGREMAELEEVGLLRWEEGSLKLTDRARLLGDEVFVRFVGSLG